MLVQFPLSSTPHKTGTHLQLHHLAVPGAAQNERSRFSINLLSLSTRRHYVLIVYVVQAPHFDRHHVPFFKERTWNRPGFKITLTENAVQCLNCNTNSEKDPLAEQLLHFSEQLREKGEGGS